MISQLFSNHTNIAFSQYHLRSRFSICQCIIQSYPSVLPVAHIDDVPGPDVLLLHFSSQVQAAHGHQVGFINTGCDPLEETMVQHTGRCHGYWAHTELHSWATRSQAEKIRRFSILPPYNWVTHSVKRLTMYNYKAAHWMRETPTEGFILVIT